MNSAPETYRFTHLKVHWTFTFALGKRPFVHPKPNVSISGYAVFGGNPIVNVDVLGDTTDYNVKFSVPGNNSLAILRLAPTWRDFETRFSYKGDLGKQNVNF